MKQGDPFEDYRTEIDDSIEKALARVESEKRERSYISLHSYQLELLDRAIKGVLRERFDASKLERLELEIPPAHVSGDIALPVFELAKSLKENPVKIAGTISSVINQSDIKWIKTAKNEGPFVNIELESETLYPEILLTIDSLGEKYGESDVNAKRVALFDYSAPNIAKPIGVGHLRSTIIGQALANVYRATGYTEIRDNHLGDWGTQFGKLIYAYECWGEGTEGASESSLKDLKDLYVRFNRESEEHPELEIEAREIFKKLEKHDPRITELWKRFRDLSVADFKKAYEKLGVQFDTSIGEGYFSELAQETIEECLEKGIARKEEGTETVIVDSLDAPSFLLRKQDGSTLYIARDLATLKFRVKTFKPNVIVYVVGSEQELNFKQLFLLGEELNLLTGAEAKHVGFGMVLTEGKKMSTRKGTLVELEELIDQATLKSRAVISAKGSSMTPEETGRVSEIVGVGAILYNDLRQSRTKNISFNWEKMLNFDGGSSPYLQYTCVRINSILKRVGSINGEMLKNARDFLPHFEARSEFELAKKLMFFPFVVIKSQRFDAIHFLASYLEELAQLFNNFYTEVSVSRTEEENLLRSRVLLITAVRNVIRKGLNLMNIRVPEKM
ncbi:MAG: arginine--tRNA ligase [Candidatus Jorgensenbacteria bacterium]